MTTFLRWAGGHELPVTTPLMPEKYPGYEGDKGFNKSGYY